MTRCLRTVPPRTLLVAFAALLTMAACGGDEEFNEDGQPVQHTDVKVVGVDLGTTVANGRLTNSVETFARGDTIYASVRTKGTSPLTILGARWKNASGEEINKENTLIRPTGDTSFLLRFHDPGIQPGRYTLDLRLNGGLVKTERFTVDDREGITVNAGASEGTDGLASDAGGSEDVKKPGIYSATLRRFAAVSSTARSEFANLAHRVAVLTGREPKDQSPFEWKGLRAGMRLSRAEQLSNPGSPWERTPFLMSVKGFRRYTAVQNGAFGAGTLYILADTTGDRVMDVHYSASWIPKDSAPRIAFEHEMIALGQKWDKMPGVIRQQTGQTTGPYFFEWGTPDSAWKGTIFYQGSVRDAGRPTGFQIEELHWDQRIMSQVTDSMKGLMRNPSSEYYHPRRSANQVMADSVSAAGQSH